MARIDGESEWALHGLRIADAAGAYIDAYDDIVFFVLQKSFMQGMMGTVKG